MPTYQAAIREIALDDAAPATELINLDYPEPITVEQMRERLRAAGPGPNANVQRLVMEERTGDAAGTESSASERSHTGRLIGYAHAVREEWQDPGVYQSFQLRDSAFRHGGESRVAVRRHIVLLA